MLKPIEDKLREKFGISKVVVCTDTTNNLHGAAGFRTGMRIVSIQRMKTIIAKSNRTTNKSQYNYNVHERKSSKITIIKTLGAIFI